MLKFSHDPDLAEQQMCAIIFYLTAFGYIDGDFDRAEQSFVRVYIRQLVEARAAEALPAAAAEVREEVIGKFVTHFLEVFEQIDREIRSLFTEMVAHDENVDEFVYAKLKLRSYEIFQSFDEDNQRELLATARELIAADGQVHPAEARFRDEVEALLASVEPLDESDIQPIEATVEIDLPTPLLPKHDNHPFFARFEEHYSSDPVRIRKQAEADHSLIMRAMDVLAEQRSRGAGKLAGRRDVGELAAESPFLDGHIYVHPAGEGEYELIVLGDLHGCYSNLKAALMQSDFFAKVEAYRLDPVGQPNPKLILLGDYIDRGRFSYNGVLRTVLQLLCTAPEHVYVLRGNHEYYVEYRGRIYGGVKPAEAINTLMRYMPAEMFEAYRNLFEALPSALLFDRILFVHAGIPRESAIAAKYVDLSSLNDPDLRFQMMWSDPSQAGYIPAELQDENARFPFGRVQFERFMATLGCTTMVRGHEKILEGFRSVYPSSPVKLLSLFSAGGADNDDLPADSSYREVRPMAMTLRILGGAMKVAPWEIDYHRYNDPTRNAFFASKPEIEHRTD